MKKTVLFLAFFIVSFPFILNIVRADIGPKATVDISVLYNHEAVTDNTFNAGMLECVAVSPTEDLSNPSFISTPLLGIKEFDTVKSCYWTLAKFAWGGNCSDSSCSFYYFPPQEFKLAVFIPSLNKLFITNSVTRTQFNSYYGVELMPDGSATISENTAPVISTQSLILFMIAAPVTIVVELISTLLFVIIRKRSKLILVYSVIGNLISLPVVWFLIPLFNMGTVPFIIVSELFAFIFEAGFIYLLGRKKLSFKESILLSLINNILSFSLEIAAYLIWGSIFVIY